MFRVQDEVWMGCKCCYEVSKDLLFVHNQVMLLCLLIVDKVVTLILVLGMWEKFLKVELTV
jgi:hypothetical protein